MFSSVLASGLRLGRSRMSVFFLPNPGFASLHLNKASTKSPICASFRANYSFSRNFSASRYVPKSASSAPPSKQVPFTASPKGSVYAAAASRAGLAGQMGVGDIPTVGLGKSSSFAKPRVISANSVGWWLILCGAAVFGIVVLGGLTRLTESGLSITEWKPLTGALPPISQEDWERQFELYKNSPEFRELNSHMTLEEYKFIYYMEWGHRLWGRAIGLLVIGPGLYFMLRGRSSPATNRQMVGIMLLLGLQGAIGWWMVHSGLDRDHLDSRADTQPRVGHYRLATHLGAAFLLYFAMTLSGLSILKQNRMLKNPVKGNQEITVLSSALATWPRRFAWALLGLAFVTCISGSFVAGLDAGLLYNSFPMMGTGLTPSTNELFDKRYTHEENPSKLTLFYKNALDNPVTVQLGHRILAVTTWSAALAYFLYIRKRRTLLPRNVMKGAHGVIGFATLQAALGITTLLYVVPVPVAALHQAGALAFLTSILVLINRLRVPKGQLRRIVRLMAEKIRMSKDAAKPPAP